MAYIGYCEAVYPGQNRMPIEIYVDGACLNNGYAGAQAGIGVFFFTQEWRHFSFGERVPQNLVRGVDEVTSNQAELWVSMTSKIQVPGLLGSPLLTSLLVNSLAVLRLRCRRSFVQSSEHLLAIP